MFRVAVLEHRVFCQLSGLSAFVVKFYHYSRTCIPLRDVKGSLFLSLCVVIFLPSSIMKVKCPHCGKVRDINPSGGGGCYTCGGCSKYYHLSVCGNCRDSQAHPGKSENCTKHRCGKCGVCAKRCST